MFSAALLTCMSQSTWHFGLNGYCPQISEIEAEVGFEKIDMSGSFSCEKSTKGVSVDEVLFLLAQAGTWLSSVVLVVDSFDISAISS